MADELLTTAQVAARTNTGKSTWDKRRLTGDGPEFLKLGAKVLYRWSDVEAWLSAHRRQSTSDHGPLPVAA